MIARIPHNASMHIEQSLDVPKTFKQALAHHPKWGESAHTELRILTDENKAIARIDADLAKQHIEAGVEVLYI